MYMKSNLPLLAVVLMDRMILLGISRLTSNDGNVHLLEVVNRHSEARIASWFDESGQPHDGSTKLLLIVHWLRQLVMFYVTMF
jgi:hypothetical protein